MVKQLHGVIGERQLGSFIIHGKEVDELVSTTQGLRHT